MPKTYNRVNWVNHETALNATHLNIMDKGIKDVTEQSNANEQAITETSEVANAAKNKADTNEEKLSNVTTYQEATSILEGGQ